VPPPLRAVMAARLLRASPWGEVRAAGEPWRTFEYEMPLSIPPYLIAFAVGERVMFPMTSDPLLGDDRRRQPQPKAHWKRSEVMKFHTPVGLRSMQEQSNGHIREVSGNDDEQHWLPPR